MKKQNNQKNDQQRPSEEIKELTLQEQINYHELDLISENYCSVEDILFEQQHNLHDFSFEAVDFDTKFRSMNTLDNYSMSNATLSTGLSEPIYTKFQTSLPSSSNKQSIVEVIPSNSNEYETLDVPNKPAILGVSQFLCTLSLIDLINKLQQKLNSIIEISYVFHADTCRVSSFSLPC